MIKKALSLITGYDALKRTGSSIKDSYARGKELKDLLKKSATSIKPDEKNADFYVWSPFAGSYTKNNTEIIVKNYAVISGFESLHNAKKGHFFSGNNFKQLMTETFTKEQRQTMHDDSRSVRIIMIVGFYFLIATTILFLCLKNWFALFSIPGIIFVYTMILRKHVYELTLEDLQLVDLKTYFNQQGKFSCLKLTTKEVK